MPSPNWRWVSEPTRETTTVAMHTHLVTRPVEVPRKSFDSVVSSCLSPKHKVLNPGVNRFAERVLV